LRCDPALEALRLQRGQRIGEERVKPRHGWVLGRMLVCACGVS
jgi:hypothetical protein